MAMRSTDLEVIHAWAASHLPEGAAERVRVRADVTAQHVTIVEGMRADTAAEWTDRPVARLKYNAKTEMWSLFWRDSRGDFHPADRFRRPAMRVSTILKAIDEDDTALFWG